MLKPKELTPLIERRMNDRIVALMQDVDDLKAEVSTKDDMIDTLQKTVDKLVADIQFQERDNKQLRRGLGFEEQE